MKTIAKIIQMCGGLEHLPVSIANEPYMRLVIEHIGTGRICQNSVSDLRKARGCRLR
jgi:hypothetical protein